jgi:hypothetical protein
MLAAPIILRGVKFMTLIINTDLPHAYLGSNIVSVPELISTDSLIRGKSEESLFVIYSIHYTRNVTKINNDAGHICEEVLNILNEQVETLA